MIGAEPMHGDPIHWHPRIRAIVAGGVFAESGHFVHIPDIWRNRAHEIRQDKAMDRIFLPFAKVAACLRDAPAFLY
jgi:hypothetical protein